MISLARNVRLVPIVVFAVASLFALKTVGIVFEGGYTLSQRPALAEAQTDPPAIVLSPGREVEPSSRPVTPPAVRAYPENFRTPEFTGTTTPPAPGQQGAPAAGEVAKDPAAGPNAKAADAPVPTGPDGPIVSSGERAVLESLNQRRLELEARARELDVRESLLAAAEKRIEMRIGELKEVEGRINAATLKKDEADAARFKGLVTMYENMKAKDAAKIFDRLDLRILVEVATQISPRRMSDILAQMTPEAAERLTMEIANRSSPRETAAPANELPKIEGRPNGT